MNVLVALIPVSLTLGIGALVAFIWCLKHGQFSDPVGDAEKILLDDDSGPDP